MCPIFPAQICVAQLAAEGDPTLLAETFVSVPGLVSPLGDAPGCSTFTVRHSWTESAVAPIHVS